MKKISLFLWTLLASISINSNAMENDRNEATAKLSPEEILIATLCDDHLPLILDSAEIKPYHETISQISQLESKDVAFKDITMESLWKELVTNDPALNKPRTPPISMSWETAIEGIYASAPYGVNVRASLISAFLQTDESKKQFLDEFIGFLKKQSLDRHLNARIGLTSLELMSKYLTNDQIGFIHECMMWNNRYPDLSYFFNDKSIFYDLLKFGKTDLAFSLTHLLTKLSNKRKELTPQPKS